MQSQCTEIKKDGNRCGAPAWQSGGAEPHADHDPTKCYIHQSYVDPAEMGRKGAKVRNYEKPLPPSKLPEVEVEETEDLVIPVLQRAVKQLEEMNATPRVMATLGQVASTLDRAIERKANRGADITKIEVEYINDWRKN